MEVNGPGHAQSFKVRCIVESVDDVFLGEGSNRRTAEQMAAVEALKAVLDE